MTTRRPLAIAMVAGLLLACWGCGFAPHDFRKMQHPEPLVRARSVGVGDRQYDAQVVPALIARLEDEDPVVRLAANEELRQRTGQDFGYLAWASPEERAGAVGRWRSWLTGPPMPAGSLQSPAMAMAPVAVSPQAGGRQARRRRRRKAQPPAAMVAIPPPQVPQQGPGSPGSGAGPGPAPPIPGPPMAVQAASRIPALPPPITEGSQP